MNLLPRAALVVVLAALAFGLVDGPARWPAACAGAATGFIVLGAEVWLRRAPGHLVAGGTVGLVVGLVAALLAATVLVARLPPSAQAAASAVLLVGCAWLGGALGAAHSGALSRGGVGPVRTPLLGQGATPKIIDTSVIIDGRIVDVISAGFLEGTIVIPQCILRELQQVADSSDPLKRNRGRKGLDVLKAIQSSDHVRVEITDEDTPEVKEVDGKLLWLAERRGAHVVTNDYNLNKVAQLRGIRVLNVNDLANAMKPVVLPGEPLNEQVIKEGKERNQGVGYLDDGTMVVVENGRRLIGQKLDVVVTSVIQTNAGKMIFATQEEDIEQRPPQRVVRRGSDLDAAPAAAASERSAVNAPSIGQG